jgi:3-oxoacyl-[acyl-carrier protein] reductase
MDFKNKVVLITGASRGIGKATAIAFAEKNAQVILNFRENEKSANETLAVMKPGNHILAKADLSVPEAIEKMIASVIESHGRIDILVNNAGISQLHEIDKVDFAAWQIAWHSIIHTNLLAVANLSFLVARHMIRQGGGRIVNIGSRGAFRGEPTQPAYGASKAGLHALSQSLAKQLGKYHIFVNAIAPGWVNTEMATAFLKDEERASIIADTALGRLITPEEIAAAVLFLSSDDAAGTTGAILDMNGASYLRT